MPRIKRWFPVSHDINADPEVWAMRRQIGEKALSIWLEFLSIADRNEGELPGDSEELVRLVAGRCQATKSTVSSVCQFAVSRLWLVSQPTLRVVKWGKYHRTEERKKVPSEPDLTRPNRTRPINTSSLETEKKRSVSKVTPFPQDWIWLKDFVCKQNEPFPKDRFLDFAWWDAVSYICGGLSLDFLEREFAAIRRWIMDNPRREPTPRGYRKFVAGWLERAYDKERRFHAQGARPTGFIKR